MVAPDVEIDDGKGVYYVKTQYSSVVVATCCDFILHLLRPVSTKVLIRLLKEWLFSVIKIGQNVACHHW